MFHCFFFNELFLPNMQSAYLVCVRNKFFSTVSNYQITVVWGFNVSVDFFDFFSNEFAVCMKTPVKIILITRFYLKMSKCELNQIMLSTEGIIKTKPLLYQLHSRPQLLFSCIYFYFFVQRNLYFTTLTDIKSFKQLKSKSPTCENAG